MRWSCHFWMSSAGATARRMWALKNKTPFAAGKAFDRDKDGHEVLCLALKASLVPRPDGLWDLAEQQDPVLLAPVLGDAVMVADSDIVPFLPGSEVTMRGTVPADVAARRQIATLSLGGMTQSLRFWPAQQMIREGRRTRIRTMESEDLPLCWTRSAGGPSPDGTLHPANPVGCGLSPPAASGEAVPLPRILAPDDRPDRLTQNVQPVGLGPIHRHWAPRLMDAGTYDDGWQSTRAPRLPRDFNPAYHFSAPPALRQPEPLRGGETLALSGFGNLADWQMRLPTAMLESSTLLGSNQVSQRLDLRRVVINLDAQRVNLLWLAAVPCDGQDHLIKSSTLRIRQLSGVVL